MSKVQNLQAKVQACGEAAQLSQAEINVVKEAVAALVARVAAGELVAHHAGGLLSVTVAKVEATGATVGRVNWQTPSGKRSKADVAM